MSELINFLVLALLALILLALYSTQIDLRSCFSLCSKWSFYCAIY